MLDSSKYSPPCLPEEPLLPRQRIIGRVVRGMDGGCSCLIMEARPGQGKSVLCRQILDSLGCPYMWLHLSPADNDPAHFVASLACCLRRFLADTGPEPDGLSSPDPVPGLVEWLRERVQQDVYLVFDDVHRLERSSRSFAVLRDFVEQVPPTVHLALLSRTPVGLAPGKALPLRLRNSELALQESDVHELIEISGADASDLQLVRRIFDLTGGWIMGAHKLCLEVKNGRTCHTKHAQPLHELYDYALRTVRAQPCCKPAVLERLAVLDEIPGSIAGQIAGDGEAALLLRSLAHQELFVHASSDEPDIFHLHPVLRQGLRNDAHRIVSDEDVRSAYRLASGYWRNQGDRLRELRYLIRAGEYPTFENRLVVYGFSLMDRQSGELRALMEMLPEDIVASYGWIQFFLGLTRLDREPLQGLPLLKSALNVLCQRGDETGELLCLSHIISTHIITTGHYREGESMLERACQLFFNASECMDDEQTLLVVRSLAMGLCIFVADVDEAGRFAALGLGLARKLGKADLEASAFMVWGYIQIFAGNTMLSRDYLEKAYQFLFHPDTGMFTRLSIRMMLFNFLFHYGDFSNYFEQKDRLIAAVGQDLVDQSIAGPFCCVWEMDIALSRGRYAEVEVLADRCQALYPELSPHLESQVLQLRAVALARQGRGDPADLDRRAAALRDLAGGWYFITLQVILAGHVRILLGQTDSGLRVLRQGIDQACAMGMPYLEVGGRIHLAEAYVLAGQDALAKEEVRVALRLMRRNDYRHFWGWTPSGMRTVFSLAMRAGIESDFVRKLAADRLGCAVSVDGTVLPLLEIRSLGGLEIVHRGVSVLRAEALTPAQRELIGLLLSSDQGRISTEAAWVQMWPDSPEDAARTKCDTLLSRLRKALDHALPGVAAGSYLARGRGMIWLENCSVDIDTFSALAHQGLRHVQLQEFWQARNALTKAYALWGGEFLPNIQSPEALRMRRSSLTRLFVRSACALAELLHVDAGPGAAMDVMEKALRADSLNERLYATAYRIAAAESPLAARRIIHRCTEALTHEGCSAEEVRIFIRNLTTPSAR